LSLTKIIGISIGVVLIVLSIAVYFLIKKFSYNSNKFVVRKSKKLSTWFLEMVPIVFLIAGILVLLFAGIFV